MSKLAFKLVHPITFNSIHSLDLNNCMSLLQGVHPLVKVKFKDFSRTFEALFQ